MNKAYCQFVIVCLILVLGSLLSCKKKGSDSNTSSGGSSVPPPNISQLPPHWQNQESGLTVDIEVMSQKIVSRHIACAGASIINDTVNIPINVDGTFSDSTGQIALNGTFVSLTFLTGKVDTTQVCGQGIRSFNSNPYGLVTIHMSGNGQGHVSADGGQGCDSVLKTCTVARNFGVTTILHASTSTFSSVFGGWSGACSGMVDCSLSINGDKDVTATFN